MLKQSGSLYRRIAAAATATGLVALTGCDSNMKGPTTTYEKDRSEVIDESARKLDEKGARSEGRESPQRDPARSGDGFGLSPGEIRESDQDKVEQ